VKGSAGAGSSSRLPIRQDRIGSPRGVGAVRVRARGPLPRSSGGEGHRLHYWGSRTAPKDPGYNRPGLAAEQPRNGVGKGNYFHCRTDSPGSHNPLSPSLAGKMARRSSGGLVRRGSCPAFPTMKASGKYSGLRRPKANLRGFQWARAPRRCEHSAVAALYGVVRRSAPVPQDQRAGNWSQTAGTARGLAWP
jgi:hypothetical protein